MRIESGIRCIMCVFGSRGNRHHVFFTPLAKSVPSSWKFMSRNTRLKRGEYESATIVSEQ